MREICTSGVIEGGEPGESRARYSTGEHFPLFYEQASQSTSFSALYVSQKVLIL